ncbi:hypothetical protein [Microbulbifer sp. SAOS-129_SWC]|uniref:hypothetical protein n=1 Tax=Microbulbifer sp. SAOS-129_SWC TaxID=3145235 RepID=UPI003217FF7D
MNFPKQYILADRPFTELPGWHCSQVRQRWLSTAPELPLVQIENAAGEPYGLLAGWVIFRGQLLQHGDTLQLTPADHGLPLEFDELGGRFLLLLHCGDDVGVLTDAGGLLSPVYNTEQKILASTPAILKRVAPQQWDESRRDALTGGKREIWYPAGATPYVGLRRLMPNHILLLANWRAQRVFPLAAGPGRQGDTNADPAALVARMADRVKLDVGALLDAGHTNLHLTGGYDSRMVLASCRERLAQCHFQTISANNADNRLDRHLAGQLARQFNLSHRLIDFEHAEQREKDAWLQRTGRCVEDHVLELCRTVRVHDCGSHEICGVGGEAIRSCLWFRGDGARDRISAAELLGRDGIPANDFSVGITEQWLETLPAGMSVGNIIDLSFIEFRLAGWAGPSVYGHQVAHPTMSPFNSGECYKAALALPESYREENCIAKDFISYLWPELLALPINRASGVMKLAFLKRELKYLVPLEWREKLFAVLRAKTGLRYNTTYSR